MSDLSSPDYIAWFKREVAVPGRFTTLYPETTDPDIAGALVDGFYRARLDGWFPGVEATLDTHQTTPDVSLTGVALIVVYAGIQFIRNELKNMPTRTNYQAPGGLGAETEYGPSVMVERLKELQEEKKDLLAQARRPSARPVYMHDGYAIRIGTLYPVERMVNYPVAYQQPSALT